MKKPTDAELCRIYSDALEEDDSMEEDGNRALFAAGYRHAIEVLRARGGYCREAAKDLERLAKENE